MFRILIALAALIWAPPLTAQQALPCDGNGVAGADNLVEPWTLNTRSFANGDVRLALLDTVEPAAAPFHLLILSPPHDDLLGRRQCRTLGMGPGMGFSGVEFEALNAGYDPATGLSFAVPVTLYDGAEFRPHLLRFTLNQASGEIRAGLQ